MRCELLACPKEVGFDSTDGKTHGFGNLFNRQILTIVEQDGLAIFRADERQSSVEGLGQFRLFGLNAGEGRAGRGVRYIGGGAFHIIERNDGPAPTQVVDGYVVQDLKKPTHEAALLVVARKVLKGTQKGFLGKVFRDRAILDQAGCEVHGWRGIAADEIAVGSLGSRERLLYQFSITGYHWHSLYGRGREPVSILRRNRDSKCKNLRRLCAKNRIAGFSSLQARHI